MRQESNLFIGEKRENQGGSPMKRLLRFGVDTLTWDDTKLLFSPSNF